MPSKSKKTSKQIINTRRKRSGPRIARGIAASIVSSTVLRGLELKHKDLPLVTNFASVGTGGAIVDLCSGIQQGLDTYNRVGRSILVSRIHLVGTLVGGQANTAPDDDRNVFRLSIGTGWPAAPLLTGGYYTLDSVLDPRTLPGLIKPFYDKTMVLAAPGRDSTGYLEAVREVAIDIRPNVYCNFTSTTVSGPISFFLWCLSDSSGVPNPGFVNGVVSVEFTDA
jgi:hypothetical protein